MKAKGYGNQSKPSPKQSYAGSNYKDRDLMHADPLKAQEELKPSAAEPVRMHARMAGCP